MICCTQVYVNHKQAGRGNNNNNKCSLPKQILSVQLLIKKLGNKFIRRKVSSLNEYQVSSNISHQYATRFKIINTFY